MKALNYLYACIGFFILALVFVQCQKEELLVEDDVSVTIENEQRLPLEYENNLSFPVIWSDGYKLKLREPPLGGPKLEGEWWYVWGDDITLSTDPKCSCKPHPIRPFLCENGKRPGDGNSTVYKAYLQKRPNNIWQADNRLGPDSPLYVDLIDWSDGLETKDWDLDSKISAQMFFYENLNIPMLQFVMKHVTGWGENEIHGLKTTLSDLIILGPGNIASVYSHNVRLTIQKLNVFRDSIPEGSLIWEPILGWTERDPNGENIINEPIMNQPVYEMNRAVDDFHVMLNTEGKVVYDYNWDVRQLNEGEGFYRLTFSFDEGFGEVPLNTFFDQNTRIMYPNQKGRNQISAAIAKLDVQNNLTYIDIRVKSTSYDDK